MNNRISFRSRVTATVYNKRGKIIAQSINHNIVTDQGDAYLADLMSNSPVRTKITAAAGYIPVGTGYTGVSNKTQTFVKTQTGASEALDATYPLLKGSWGATDDNVIIYKATYEAGDLNANGINEAAITSHASAGASCSCLAYAEITPSVNVTINDTLEVQWEIELLGS
jgi:hypothetical protein